GVGDLDPRPAELLDPAVLPDPGAVVEGPEAVRVLLYDEHHGVVVEAHRHVEPPHALERRVRGRPRGWRLAGGTDPPGAVPGADPGVGRDRDLLAVDGECAAPGAHLGE